MRKLLWLDINCSYAHSSLALPAIHAQCSGGDTGWSVVSGTLSTPSGTLVEQITRNRPDIIAATAWLFTHDYLLNIISRVKALLPGCTVILGGPEFLGDNETYLHKHPEIDCVFRGEGELEFHKWLMVSDNAEDWVTVTGLCMLDREGKYHDGGIARVQDFAGLAPPEKSRFFNWEKPFVQLETTRGCFNDCAFCVSGAEKPVRTTSTESVQERIKNIYEHGIREIRLLDRTFNSDTKRTIELINIFSGFSGMRFHLELHPALLPGNLRRVLESLPENMLHLEAGIQSLREPVLKACKRKGGFAEALDGLRFLCGLKNMETHSDLIVGVPEYTLEQVFEDIRTLASFGSQEIQLELLKVLPGTAMRYEAEKLGLVYSPVPPYEILKTGDMSVADIQTGRLLSRLLDFYYNASAWQEITMELVLQESDFLKQFLTWMRRGEKLEQPLSIAKRGLLLYEFISGSYPAYKCKMQEAWLSAGLSHRKLEQSAGIP